MTEGPGFKRSVGLARALGRIQEPHVTGVDWNLEPVLRRRERAIPVRVVCAVRVVGVAEIDNNVICLSV